MSNGKKGRHTASAGIFDWCEAIVKVLFVIIVVFTFLLKIAVVSGESMMPTLQNGDVLLISDLFYEPQPGDIVVLRKKTFMEQAIVKRVIAIEGQTLEIDAETGAVGSGSKRAAAETQLDTGAYGFCVKKYQSPRA